MEGFASLFGGSGVVPITALSVLALLAATRAQRPRCTETYKRGALLRESSRTSRAASRRRYELASHPLSWAGLPLSPLDETKHFKLIGTTGTGKSTAIRELLAAALARGDRAIIADPDGGYCKRFFDRFRGDIVLNPFERNSRAWDLFGEIVNPYDIEELANALIPTGEDQSANEWRGYARTLIAAVIRRCHAERRTCAELWRLLSVGSADELRKAVAGTPAQPFLDEDNARMFGSIRSVTVSAIAALQHVQAQRAPPLSIRRWVRESNRSGVLFIPYTAVQISALRTVIATWMRLGIVEAMSGREDVDQRLWLVIDELDALGAIDGLKDALARLRKFGGRCVLGFQSIAQVSGTYGNAGAQTIVENCSNTLILRCSGSEQGGTSQFASRLIGERELIRRQTAHGSDRDSLLTSRAARRSKNVSEQHVLEAAVLPSQIEQLPDFCGYLKRASSGAWYRVKLAADEHRVAARSPAGW